MSTENICDVNDAMKQIAEVISHIQPEDIIVTDEQAMDIMREILNDIPPKCRKLLPEDDALAAIAYAQVYYDLRRK